MSFLKRRSRVGVRCIDPSGHTTKSGFWSMFTSKKITVFIQQAAINYALYLCASSVDTENDAHVFIEDSVGDGITVGWIKKQSKFFVIPPSQKGRSPLYPDRRLIPAGIGVSQVLSKLGRVVDYEKKLLQDIDIFNKTMNLR